jgi:hypothetical protein
MAHTTFRIIGTAPKKSQLILGQRKTGPRSNALEVEQESRQNDRKETAARRKYASLAPQPLSILIEFMLLLHGIARKINAAGVQRGVWTNQM